MTIKMTEIKEFRGVLKVLGSGLRIGGSTKDTEIGEVDNPIIRNPMTGIPYIPGSSIKGKIRCLLELKYSPESQKSGKPCGCGICYICKIFGCGNARKIKSPTRIVFRDCQPTSKTLHIWKDEGKNSEIKTEVLIDRKTGTAAGHIGPRETERIPANSDFYFRFSLRFFEGDDKKALYQMLAEGFELLEKHYLGGSGSRGYGEVEILSKEGGEEVPMQDYLRKLAG